MTEGQRVRWGDEADSEDDDLLSGVPLDEPYESEVDANGVKTVVSFGADSLGRRTRTVRKVKVTEREVLVPKSVLARRNMAKFGQCSGVPPGIEDGITSLGDEVFISSVQVDTKAEPQPQQKDEMFTVSIKCRICGEEGDHWTSKCPYKNRLDELPEQADDLDALADDDDEGAAGMPELGSGDVRSRGASAGGGGGGGYVPPHLRGGGGGAGGAGGDRSAMRRDDSNSLRVTNLDEDVTQSDLEDLFKPFGPTTRIFLAKDRKTGKSRGFAFVTFVRHADAARAIEKLNGRGYGFLILSVTWAEEGKGGGGNKRRY